jgi:hypothetical protein
VARKRNPLTTDEFFASLNNQGDLRAITHGHQALVDVVDEAVEKLLADRGMTSEPVQRLGIEGQVDVLVLADRLDADLRALIDHLTRVRHRMVHGYGFEFTKVEGATCLRLLPDRVRTRMSAALDKDRPGHVIRWAIVTTHARVTNRAIHGHEADIPF